MNEYYPVDNQNPDDFPDGLTLSDIEEKEQQAEAELEAEVEDLEIDTNESIIEED